jgi:hypothetical protein
MLSIKRFSLPGGNPLDFLCGKIARIIYLPPASIRGRAVWYHLYRESGGPKSKCNRICKGSQLGILLLFCRHRLLRSRRTGFFSTSLSLASRTSRSKNALACSHVITVLFAGFASRMAFSMPSSRRFNSSWRRLAIRSSTGSAATTDVTKGSITKTNILHTFTCLLTRSGALAPVLP